MKAGEANSVCLPIVPATLGQLSITVKAQIVMGADAVKRQILVEVVTFSHSTNYKRLTQCINELPMRSVLYHHWCCEFESRSGLGVQLYVIQFVSDLQQFGGFTRVFQFPPSIIMWPDWSNNQIKVPFNTLLFSYQISPQRNDQTVTQVPLTSVLDTLSHLGKSVCTPINSDEQANCISLIFWKDKAYTWPELNLDKYKPVFMD